MMYLHGEPEELCILPVATWPQQWYLQYAGAWPWVSTLLSLVEFTIVTRVGLWQVLRL